MLTYWSKSQLAAGDIGIEHTPGLITDCPPGLVPAKFDSTGICVAAIDKPEVCILAEY